MIGLVCRLAVGTLALIAAYRTGLTWFRYDFDAAAGNFALFWVAGWNLVTIWPHRTGPRHRLTRTGRS